MGKGNKCYVASSVLCFMLLAGADALLIASLLSKEWLTKNDNTKGLWETCDAITCNTNDNILQFSSNRIRDVILLVNICAVAFTSIAFAIMLIEFCSFKAKLCSLVIISVTSTLAGFASILMVVFAQTMFKTSAYDYGWGFSTVFAGTAVSILSIIFHFLAFCFRSEDSAEDDDTILDGTLSNDYYLPGRDLNNGRARTSEFYVNNPSYQNSVAYITSNESQDNINKGRTNASYTPYQDHMYLSESRY